MLILSLTSGSVSAALIPSDVTGKSLTKALNVLIPLKVVNGYPDGEFKPQNNVTRAEFVSMLMRIMPGNGFDDIYTNSDIEYTDVPKDHWAYSLIKAASVMGIIVGMGDGTFRPEEGLTPEQASKMVVSLLGYAPMAEKMGGYPDGYTKVALQTGLLKHASFSLGKPADREFAAVLLYNALYTEICEQQYDGSYKVEDGETFFSKKLEYLDLTEKEGVVTANSYSSFNDSNYENENHISVDNCSYISGELDVDDFLGYRVSYYVDDNDIIYSMIKKDTGNKEISIGYKSDITLEGKKLRYTDKDKRSRTVMLDDDAVVMNNFERIINPTKSDFEIESGALKLIDNNGDNKYDVVFIMQYTTHMIESADAENGIINLKAFSDKGQSTFKGKKVIDSEDYRMRIYDTEGNEVDLKDLRHNQIICIYSNKENDYLKAVVTDKVVEGEVQALDFEDNQVVISGVSYDWTPDILELSTMDKGRFWLDIDGKVTAKSIGDDNEHRESVHGNSYGYIKGIHKDIRQHEVLVKMLVYMKDGTIKEDVLTLQDRLTFNRQKTSAAKVYDNLGKNIPVRYSLNSKGNINEIDNLEEVDEPGYRKYNRKLNCFDRMYGLDDEMVYIIAAEDDEEIYTQKDYALKDGNYYVEMYKYGDGEDTDRIFFVYATMKKYDSMDLPSGENAALIESYVNKVDDAGEDVKTVIAYINGKKEEIDIYSYNKAYDVLENAKRGSIVLLDVNEQGIIENARMVFDGNAEKQFRLNVGGKNEKIFGIAESTQTNADRTSSIIKVRCNDKTIGYDVSQAYIYDVSDKVFEKVDIDTINTIEHSSEPADIFILSANYKPVMVLAW